MITLWPREKQSAQRALDWFPQAFGVGGLDASGSERLLGQPSIELLELLIREAAQNSWDARLGGGVPEFGMTCRVLAHDELDVLRTRIFQEPGTSTRIPHSLHRRSAAVLEIYDRGTTGLDGPVRADRSLEPGTPTNFIDLVFNVGTANKSGDTGGTFGFGKSSLFRASRSRAVVYWSVCRRPGGGTEHRLIATALGESFDLDDRRYTGRHWWGHLAEHGTRIEPLVGEEAEDLGALLFRRGFAPGETGTSILVLDPEPSMLSYSEEIVRQDVDKAMLPGIHDRITKMMFKNLWPKIAGLDGTPRMGLVVDGQLLSTQDESRAFPVLPHYRTALEAVRSWQGGQNKDLPITTVVEEVWCLNPKKLVGHLAICWVPDFMVGDEDRTLLTDRATTIPWNAVCLMRNQAELVVKYREYPALGTQGLRWVAVFKPARDVDAAFAASETPAHDDWMPKAMERSHEKTYVNRAITVVGEKIRAFVVGKQATPETSAATSAAALATDLADLGVVGDATPTTDKPGGGGGSGRGNRTAGVEIAGVRLLPDPAAGIQRQRLSLDLTGQATAWADKPEVVISVSVATGDGTLSMKDLGIRATAQWGAAFDASGADSLRARFVGNSRDLTTTHRIDLCLPAGYAFKVSAEVVA